MKTIAYIGIGCAALALGYFVVKKVIKSAEKQARHDLDEWIDRTIIEYLVKKLDVDEESINRAFLGRGDEKTKQVIEEYIVLVNVEFLKSDDNSKYEIVLTLAKEDETAFVVKRRVDWDEMPNPIRQEFLTQKVGKVSRPWYLPWKSDENKEC